jgi:dTDP-4-amino-4,6-dideoxygalactose transaminase
MVTTNSKTISNYITTYRNHGITKSLLQRFSHGKPWDYDIIEPGHNYRIDEVRSALGINQLKRISVMNDLRRKAAKYYIEQLSQIDGIEVPQLSKSDENVYHLFIIKIKEGFGISRDKLYEKLLKKGIRTSVHYKPLHMFTIFQNRSKMDRLDNSTKLYNEILSLPMFPTLTKRQQDYVVKCIKDAHLD